MGLLDLTDPVEFEPVSQLSSVFFDAERGQVLSVRGGGVTGVVVKSLEENILTVRLQTNTSEPIMSIKLSPSLATLAVQRSRQTVNFLPVSAAGPDDQAEYSQPARAKHCALLGFLWLSNSELLYITSAYYIVTSSQAETDTIPVWSVRGGNIVKVSNLALHLISVYLSAYISVKVDHQIKLFIINNDGVSLTQVQAATP